jgi:hypothetical protein
MKYAGESNTAQARRWVTVQHDNVDLHGSWRFEFTLKNQPTIVAKYGEETASRFVAWASLLDFDVENEDEFAAFASDELHDWLRSQETNSPAKVWLAEFLCQISDPGNREIVSAYLRKELRRCNSKSRERFRLWLRMTLARAPSLPVGIIDGIDVDWNEPLHEDLQKPSLKLEREPFEYHINGAIALISLTNAAGDSVVWKIPADRLDWAKNIAPVYLNKLAPLEPSEAGELRRLKVKQKRTNIFKNMAEREASENEVARLTRVVERLKSSPTPQRYSIMKTVDGKEVQVHRLFLNAGLAEEVIANDGDFTNYTSLPVRTITTPTYCDGVRYEPDLKAPRQTTTDVDFFSNLELVPHFVVPIAKSQEKFEKSMLSIKFTPHGDIDDRLPTLPNADLGRRTGVGGGFVNDCGKSASVTEKERQGIDEAEVKTIRDLWLNKKRDRPRPQRGW